MLWYTLSPTIYICIHNPSSTYKAQFTVVLKNVFDERCRFESHILRYLGTRLQPMHLKGSTVYYAQTLCLQKEMRMCAIPLFHALGVFLTVII